MTGPAAGTFRGATPRPPRTPSGRRAETRASQDGGEAGEREWLQDLRSEGRARDEAVARLHRLLLRAARFEVARRARTMPHLRGNDLDDVALQSADDALVAVMAKLDRFRGQSRFSTWAYKFALLEAAVKLRRLAWQGREVPLEPEDVPRLRDHAASPQARAEQRELIDAVRRAIASELTPHQREVLVALVLNDVPIDVLAERLGTTRGALYKTLHDGRRKLRRRLAAEGRPIGLADTVKEKEHDA